jgi:hypothetical protein
MDISSTVGVAAAYEGARNAGIQQATTSATTDDVKRDDKKQAQDLDVKQTDMVSGTTDNHASSNTNHKLNVLV